MVSWVCKRCETANSAETRMCEVCSSPMLYTHEEVEKLIANRVAAAKAKATATLAATKAAISPPSDVETSSDCNIAWAVAVFLAVMLFLFLFG